MECAPFAETSQVLTSTTAPECATTAGASFVVAFSQLRRARQYSVARSNVEIVNPAGMRSASWLGCGPRGLRLKRVVRIENHRRGLSLAVQETIWKNSREMSTHSCTPCLILSAISWLKNGSIFIRKALLFSQSFGQVLWVGGISHIMGCKPLSTSIKKAYFELFIH